jgi:molecular chaperone GrpE
MDQDLPDTENDDARPSRTTPDETAADQPATLDGECTDGVEQLRQQVEEANDRALRSQAELDNFRKRTLRELESERRYAAMPLLRDLLPVIDNIHRAIEAAQQSQDAGGLLEGVKIVAQQLISGMERQGCTQIQANAGDPFDPSIHEAVSQMANDQFAAGAIIQATQAGYQLHDRVIRAAQVIVSSGLAEEGDR